MLGYYNERGIWSLSEIKKKKQWFNLMQDPPAEDKRQWTSECQFEILLLFSNVVQKTYDFSVFESAIFCLTTR